MSTSTEEKRLGPATEKMVPIAVRSLPPSVLEFDLYAKRSPADDPILYCGRGYSLKSTDIARLLDRNIRTVYVGQRAHATYRAQVLEVLAESKDISPGERYSALREVNRSIFETTHEEGTVDELVDLSADIGKQLAEVVCDNSLVLSDLFHLMEHDNYTYTHCVNVCTYSLMLARSLGISDPSDLGRIANGALLHDVGKRGIRRSVLNKRGALNGAERKHIQTHPALGFRSLFLREDMSWGELMMVYQHHERIDGTGYPVEIPEREIHAWARICSVADVFHAITSDRPYRPAGSVEEANSVLQKEAGFSLDGEVVKCWMETMKPPVDSYSCCENTHGGVPSK